MALSTVATVVLALIGLGGLFYFVSVYNALVSLKNQIERAFANIDVVLKQRFDEIPQLIEVAQQYAEFEAGLIQKLADARTRYGAARSEGEKFAASNQMSSALQGFFAIAENYPALKTNENFVHLQQRVSHLEGTLADRREVYNDTVTLFNTRIEQLPDVFVARLLGYQARYLFKIAESERVRPPLKVNLPK
jgi:LemA protein